MPPAEPSPPPEPDPAPRPSGAGAIALLFTMLPILVWGACAADAVSPKEVLSRQMWVVASLLSVVGSFLGLTNLIRLKREDPQRTQDRLMSVGALIFGLLSPFVSFFMGLLSFGSAALDHVTLQGRPLRRGGRARSPTPGMDTGWVEELGATLPAPPAVAAAWRANAAAEAASIAAFAHLSNELLALGAPAHLLEKAHADALDEIRHARLCYGIASAMDGEKLGPASFPAAMLPREGRLDLASLAAECIVESCVFEAASARVAAVLASRADVPGELRAVLSTIAADEARHAAHGWEIIAWCRETGDPSVDVAMRAALARVNIGAVTAPVDHDALEHWGIAGPSVWRRCVAEALTDAHSRLGGTSAHSQAA